jgi:hypothetical protein
LDAFIFKKLKKKVRMEGTARSSLFKKKTNPDADIDLGTSTRKFNVSATRRPASSSQSGRKFSVT